MNTYLADIKLSIKTQKTVQATTPISAQVKAGTGLHDELTLSELLEVFGDAKLEVSLNNIKCTKLTEEEESTFEDA